MNVRIVGPVALVAAAVWVGGPATAAEHDVRSQHAAAADLVVATTGSVRRFGGFNSLTEAPRLPLIARFGAPTFTARTDVVCRMKWNTLGLNVWISKIGALAGDPCEVGFVTSVAVWSNRWRSANGVRVGDRTSRARAICTARYGASACIPVGRRVPLQMQQTSCELNPGRHTVVYAQGNSLGRVSAIRAINLVCE